MNAQTVKVEILHERNAGTHWVRPVGWEPKWPDTAQADWLYEEGAFWSDAEEEMGMAIDHTDNPRGDYDEVPIERLFWSTSGDCRFAGHVEAAD